MSGGSRPLAERVYKSSLSDPMETPIDIPATDKVTEEIGYLLQRWAKGIGVDHHDTAEGHGFRCGETYIDLAFLIIAVYKKVKRPDLKKTGPYCLTMRLLRRSAHSSAE